jgi:4-oxalocrotonate tautomerase
LRFWPARSKRPQDDLHDFQGSPALGCNAARGRTVTRGITRGVGIVGAGIHDNPKENVMPFVNVRLIEGVFTPEQKAQMISGITEALVAIEGENLRPVTWVVVDEVKSGDWGIGGKGLKTADVHALQGKTPVSVAG